MHTLLQKNLMPSTVDTFAPPVSCLFLDASQRILYTGPKRDLLAASVILMVYTIIQQEKRYPSLQDLYDKRLVSRVRVFYCVICGHSSFGHGPDHVSIV